MSPRRQITEYEFEIRSVGQVPKQRPRPQTEYWQRFIKVAELMAEGAALFVRSAQFEPNGKEISRLRNVVKTQLQRFRPEYEWDVIRALEDGGVYVVRRPKTVEAVKAKIMPPPLMYIEDPDPDEDPTGAEPQGVAEEEEDAYELRYQGEPADGDKDDDEEALAEDEQINGLPPIFVDWIRSQLGANNLDVEGPRLPDDTLQDEPAIEDAEPLIPLQGEGHSAALVIAREAAESVSRWELKAIGCGCPPWWTSTPLYKKNDSRLVGPFHHEACRLYSTWQNVPYLEACNCFDSIYHDGSKGLRGDEWHGPGEWHSPSCPRHVHRWILPAADRHEPGTPFVGVCACGETKDNQPYQDGGGTLLVMGAAKTAKPIPTSTAALTPRNGYCPVCGGAWRSQLHKICKAEKAKENA